MSIDKIVKSFLTGEVIEIKENNSGIINNTYIVSVMENGVLKKYTLQKVNIVVFPEPYGLMENILNVTDYCREYLTNNGEDPDRGTLSVIKTLDGDILHKTESGEYYRMYNFIADAITYDKAKSAEMFGNVGFATGKFMRMSGNYPIDKLKETIPDFHNSKVRFKKFLLDVEKDSCGRVKDVLPEIEFLKKRKDMFNVIVDLLEQGIIPKRPTHNDTKTNNVLFDIVTGEPLCLIDLDTVMPGYVGYDFGDANRNGAALTAEDDPNLENVGIDMQYFRKFTERYLEQTHDILTNVEIEYLAFSCILIALELSMRFLNDYINGNVYFKCNYPEHNLVRARNQMKLAEEMEKHYPEMKQIVYECRKNVKKKVLEKNHNR